jgi:hypothetical protein
MIIVAGHAICLRPERAMSDESWVLLPYQEGEAGKYVEHIRAGVAEAASDEGALLVFAGGCSRADAGPRSEGASYWAVAEAKGWFGHAGVRERTITEEFSRDSYENLLYSICRGKEYRGSYPDFVTFVSWEFKRERFDLHRRGIGWPLERFSYLGVNNPEALEQASRAEAATRAGYERDPYSGSAEFRAKKEARNPFRRRHGYSESCQELRELMEYGGPDWFVGRLPWG